MQISTQLMPGSFDRDCLTAPKALPAGQSAARQRRLCRWMYVTVQPWQCSRILCYTEKKE